MAKTFETVKLDVVEPGPIAAVEAAMRDAIDMGICHREDIAEVRAIRLDAVYFTAELLIEVR